MYHFYILSIYCALSQITNTQCGELFIINFIVLVPSRLRTSLLAVNEVCEKYNCGSHYTEISKISVTKF